MKKTKIVIAKTPRISRTPSGIRAFFTDFIAINICNKNAKQFLDDTPRGNGFLPAFYQNETQKEVYDQLIGYYGVPEDMLVLEK